MSTTTIIEYRVEVRVPGTNWRYHDSAYNPREALGVQLSAFRAGLDVRVLAVDTQTGVARETLL